MNQNTYTCFKSNITLHVLSKSASHSHLHISINTFTVHLVLCQTFCRTQIQMGQAIPYILQNQTQASSHNVMSQKNELQLS
jgi:hypothetical protein